VKERAMPNVIVEIETGNLRSLILTIDYNLTSLLREAWQHPDPDGFGYFDNAEHVAGIGLVTCQTFMAAVYGGLEVEKAAALAIGPAHSCGLPVAKIVNDAANFWKHYNEWPDAGDKRRQPIAATFDTVGVALDGEYPLSKLLDKLAPHCDEQFEAIADVLEVWKSEVYRIA
jgi:hypothetical protein